MLLPALADPPSGRCVRVAERSLSYAELAHAAGVLAARLPAHGRVGVMAERRIETIVAVVAGLLAGTPVVPVNPTSVPRELEHQLGDAAPAVVLHPADLAVPAGVATDLAVGVSLDDLLSAPAPARGDEPPAEAPAVVMYTSGTTGPPKGVVLSRAAIAANLDALAGVWQWTAADRLVHALPLYHVHGLILGVLGPLRVGGDLHHLGSFDAAATAAAFDEGATMHFGVPTIYHRLSDAADADPAIARALRRARLLVSGSAGLPLAVHERIEALTGLVVVERYGMTETMITTAVPAGTEGKAGTVGPALPGVELRVIDEDGRGVEADGEAMGGIVVRTPSMFTGYLNRPDATADAFRDGWFVTGDVATIDADGFVRILGRDSTDIIKSGGYKIGAGEIEDVLREHSAVADAAVAGVADPDLGERVTAWIELHAAAATTIDLDELHRHVADRLARHKRPRVITVVDGLPRNGLGKVQKNRLTTTDPTTDPMT